jgi:hypothetical protein
VLVTAGRFAGKKAIVARNYEDGTKVLSILSLEIQISPFITCGYCQES